MSRAVIVAAAQNRARDLGNRPPNDLTPTALGVYAAELAAERPALTVSVLGGEELRRLGMGMFAAVAAGSDAGSPPDHADLRRVRGTASVGLPSSARR